MLRGRRVIATITLLAVLTAGSILGQSGSPAFAVDYPSWDDVQAARQSQAATQAEVTRVQGLLAGLQAAVDSTQAVAVLKGDEYQAAQQKYDEAAFKAAELQKQADAAQVKAAKSKQQAGQLAARLSRSAGNDLSTRLFFSGGDSKAYLAQLGLESMVKDQSAGIYEKAIQDQNTAQSLTDQADVAKAALKILADAAQKALAEATTAAQAADASANMPTPIAKMRRRPKWSPNAPPTSSSAANNKAYDSTTHCAWKAVARKSRWMAGKATLTTVPSMKAMLEPTMAAASTQGREACGYGVVADLPICVIGPGSTCRGCAAR